MWRPAFVYEEREPAVLPGWARRFWQGSTDHRGVPGAPGRVATLLRDEAASCWGTAYRVGPTELAAVLRRLDHREKGGYERHRVRLSLARSGGEVEALVYVATEENPNFLGPAPLAEIAAEVRRSRGPSGTNLEYVLELAQALRSMGAHDPHVFELAALLEEP